MATGLSCVEMHEQQVSESTPDSIIAEEMARAMQRAGASTTTQVSVGTSIKDHPPDISLEPQLCRINQLPEEILLHIFQLTRDPIHRYDPSIMQGPHSSWMRGLRTRKALTLTCKAFLGPATAILYDDIVLRRMGQIPALARTLDPSRTPSAQTLSQLVRSIRIDSCVVWDAFAEVVKEELRSIFEHCTMLQAFSFIPHWQHDDSWLGQKDPVLHWLIGSDPSNRFLQTPLTRGLSNLSLTAGSFETPALLHGLHTTLTWARQLVSLKLRTTSDPFNVEWNEVGDSSHLSLWNLTEFQLHMSDGCKKFLDYICHWWDMPRLSALTLVTARLVPFPSFLRAHGEHLRYLHWYTGIRLSAEDHNALLTCCPRLEHLVINIYRTPAIPQLCSPTLRFLDIWEPQTLDLIGQGPIAASSVGPGTPRLERVRILSSLTGPDPRYGPSRYCLNPASLDRPRICHPTAVEDGNHLVWCFPHFRIIQTSWSLYTDERWEAPDAALVWEDADALSEPVDAYDEDEEGDATFVFSEGDSSEGSGSLSEGESDEVSAEIWPRIQLRTSAMGPEPPEEPVDRDILLDIFHRDQSREILYDDALSE
ncbi:hypothetical protein FKP32DRAFT_1676052 [Trametes sanguinea]|nr:hypothetical protein FKP32DRAFT_1676052 [Trametes sanguinea]